MNEFTFSVDTSTIIDAVPYSDSVIVRDYGATEFARRFLSGNDISGRPSVEGPRRPYLQSVWTYICIHKLGMLASSLPLKITTEDMETDIKNGPVVDFWKSFSGLDPNTLNLKELVRQTVGWGELTGEKHWILKSGRLFGNAQMSDVGGIELVVGKPVMKAKLSADGTKLDEWELSRPKGKKDIIPLERVISDINWSPYDLFRGISPVDAAALSISQDWQASTFNERSLANNAEPGGYLYEDDPKESQLDETQAAQIESVWNANHRGSSRAGRITVLYGGLKWESCARTYTDMCFPDLKKMSREEILGVWNMPKVLVGLAEDANYGFAEAEQEIFWNDTMLTVVSDLNAMFQAVTDRITGKPDSVKVWLDISAAPIFAQLEMKKVDKAEKLFKIGAPFNEISDKLKLGYEESEWGKVWWAPRGLKPADKIMAEPDAAELLTMQSDIESQRQDNQQQQEQQDQDKKEDKKEKELADLRAQISRAWMHSWYPLELKFKGQLRQYFIKLEKEILGRISQHTVKGDNEFFEGIKHGMLSMLDSKDEVQARVDINALWGDGREHDKALKLIAQTHFDRALKLGFIQSVTEAGANIDDFFLPADPVIEAMKQRKTIQVVANNETTRKRLETGIRKAVSESNAAGETLQGLATRIQETVKGTFRTQRHHSQTIARTETAQCINHGRHEANKRVGLKLKMWITAHDEAVRPTHRAAEYKYGSPESAIDINQEFEVGNARLRHPNDPNGPPEEIINCRCAEIAISDKQGRNISLQQILEKGFISCQSKELLSILTTSQK